MRQNKKRSVAVGDVFLFASCKLGHSPEFSSDWALDREEGGRFTKVIDEQSNDETLVDVKCVMPCGKGFVFMFVVSIHHPCIDCIQRSQRSQLPNIRLGCYDARKRSQCDGVWMSRTRAERGAGTLEPVIRCKNNLNNLRILRKWTEREAGVGTA